MTLLEFLRRLLGDSPDSLQLRGQFTADPGATLTGFGLGDLSPDDVLDALVLVQDNDMASFDGGRGVGPSWSPGGGASPIPAHRSDIEPAEQIRQQLLDRYSTDNSGDRDVGRSVGPHAQTQGGTVDQRIDDHSVIATGDGAVAAGDGIQGPTITTGDGDGLGNGNQVVSGDGDSTAFGSGSAVEGVAVEGGSAFSGDGDASVDASTNDSHNQTWTEDNIHTPVRDFYDQETDNSVETRIDDHSQTHVGSVDDVDLHFG